MESMSVHFKKDIDLVTVCRVFKNGDEDNKTMSLLDFVNALTSSLENVCYTDLGELPFGYYRGSISPTNAATFKVAVTIPQDKRILSYYGEEHLVPFPELLFMFKVKSGKITDSRVYSVINSKSSRKVAHYPYGNVYNDASICWGSNVLPRVENMKGIERIIDLFFGSETNDHLYTAGRNIIKRDQFYNQRGLILAAEGRKIFPVKWLISKEYSLIEVVNNYF